MAPLNILRTVLRTVLMRSHAAKYAACVVLACVAAVVVAVPVFGQTTPVTLVGAGDIADCSYSNDEGTAQLLGSTLRSLTPDRSLPSLEQARAIAMGDNAYPRANRTQYANCYDNYNLDSSFSTFDASRPDWWGNDAYIRLTMPVLGNHEYMNSDDDSIKSRPYFDYFSAQNGFQPPAAPVPNDPDNDNNHGLTFGEGYYSYDLGSWHIVALNSNCDKVGGCDASSPQGKWLQNDLATNTAQCTLAYFHHPLYATANGTNTLNVKPLWDVLYADGADVILSGHAHRYELHNPMTPEGLLDPATGIRQLVVGTGGEPGGSVIDANQVPQGVLKKVIIDKFGVIKVNLDAGSYDWEFIAVDGTANGTVMDSGTDQCHGVPGSTGTTPPTVTTVSPGNGGSDVPIGSKVEATFSEAMDASTIRDATTGISNTFTLTKPDGPADPDTNPDQVSGTVTYDSTSNTATLTPSADLDYSTTYTATVKGGADGVKDAAGNPLSADEVWTFTTAPAAPSNLTATRSGSPGNQSINLTWTDNSSYEWGFVIERSKDKNFTMIEQTYDRPVNTTSYRDGANLLKKTTYYYRVFAAADSTGTRSAPSNVASATTK
jgi:acid phosphatase type 7